ncbi:YceI family protein [Hymenobacter saemangeumensis]|uniref:YceI family protein n=1 Tax=Hymenobacter saemangeumensis TaxID=1084522 RepID=A0ABP8ITD7_9BACT
MKKILLPAFFAVATLAASVPATFAQKAEKVEKAITKGTAYKVQPQLSTLGWVAKKVTGQHNGTVQFKEGTVLVQGNQVAGGTFVVDMNTIKVEDLTDANYNGKLVGHLKADDFFGVDKHPTATFVITKVAPIKGAAAEANNANITGNLTIKGITKPVTFPAKVGVKEGLASASGTAVIDRTQFDIRYGSKSFFESIGDKAIDNDFTMSFNVIAKQ